MNISKTVEAILNKDEKAVDHIIDQNKRFQTNIDELLDELLEVKTEKKELEEENDSLNKSKTILQGYMKNVYEMNKIEKQLKKNYITISTNFKKMFYAELVNYLIFYIILFYVCNPVIKFTAFFGYVSIVITFAFYNFKNEKKLNARNNKMKQELIVLAKATDLVNDLFDSL
jgi:DNA repair exonuclease SbcCD ATPase subunit